MSLVTFLSRAGGMSFLASWKVESSSLAHLIQVLGGNNSWLGMTQVNVHLAKIKSKGSVNVVAAGISSSVSFTTGLQRNL